MPSFKDQIKDSFSDCKRSNDWFSMSIIIFVISSIILIVIFYLFGITNDFLKYCFHFSGVVCVISFIGSLICPITTIYGEMKKKQNNKIQPIG